MIEFAWQGLSSCISSLNFSWNKTKVTNLSLSSQSTRQYPVSTFKGGVHLCTTPFKDSFSVVMAMFIGGSVGTCSLFYSPNDSLAVTGMGEAWVREQWLAYPKSRTSFGQGKTIHNKSICVLAAILTASLIAVGGPLCPHSNSVVDQVSACRFTTLTDLLRAEILPPTPHDAAAVLQDTQYNLHPQRIDVPTCIHWSLMHLVSPWHPCRYRTPLCWSYKHESLQDAISRVLVCMWHPLWLACPLPFLPITHSSLERCPSGSSHHL